MSLVYLLMEVMVSHLLARLQEMMSMLWFDDVQSDQRHLIIFGKDNSTL